MGHSRGQWKENSTFRDLRIASYNEFEVRRDESEMCHCRILFYLRDHPWTFREALAGDLQPKWVEVWKTCQNLTLGNERCSGNGIRTCVTG